MNKTTLLLKKTTLLSFFLAFFLNVKSQDLIKFNSGELIEVKVTEIGDETIKYKKHSNLEGPSYSKKKSDIKYIRYENGSKDTFSENQKESSTASYTKVPNKKVSTEKAPSEPQTSQSSVKTILPPENDGVNIGQVKKLNGVDIYCLSQPLLKYSVVYSAGNLLSDLDAKTIVTGGLARAHVSDKMNKLIKAALKKAEKENKSFDAVIYSGGKSLIAIKYEVNEIPNLIYSKVNNINNVAIYAFAEPTDKSFEVSKKAKAKSSGIVSMGSYGLVNSSIEEDLTKMVKRLDSSKKRKIDAVIYSTGKTGVGIKYI